MSEQPNNQDDLDTILEAQIQTNRRKSEQALQILWGLAKAIEEGTAKILKIKQGYERTPEE